MKTLEPILAQHPFFRDLSPGYRQFIVECAANVRFQAGEYLCHEGEAAMRPLTEKELAALVRGGLAPGELVPQGEDPSSASAAASG